MHYHIAVRRFAGLVISLLLVGCGGGDGGGAGSSAITPVIAAPVISAGSLPTGSTGVSYPGFTFTVASGGTAPFTWGVSATGLPGDMGVTTGGQLIGVPVSSGTYSISVTVTDSSVPALTATQPFQLLINASPLVINTPALPVGTASYAYPSFGLNASGGSAPFAWSAAGALPAGMTLDTNGMLSGTPAAVGSFPVAVTVTDSEPTPVTASATVTVVIAAPAALAIAPIDPISAPPAGVHGTPYPTYQFAASGGYLPQVWSVTAGSIPPGLKLGPDGSLSGTPTAAGTFTFTATVTDTAPTPASASVTTTAVITEPPSPTITAGAPPTATINYTYQGFAFAATDGLAPLRWSATGNLAGLMLGLDGMLAGTPTSTGHFPITVNVTDALNQSAAPALRTLRVSLARDGSSIATGSMAAPRTGHTATLLPSGRVLITGGVGLASAELYDPATGMFTATGPMATMRSGHSAILLTDAGLPAYGEVLIVGGAGATAELYDPSTGTFAATGSMAGVRSGQTATLLKSGKVLIAGGGTTTAELYDPASGIFTATGSMSRARAGHTATLLPDGTVLVAGGGTETAELYHAASGTFTATGSMSTVRTGATATPLPDGTVLIAGGPDNTAELFDPTTGAFSRAGDLLSQLSGFTATLRSDAGVVVVGGAYSRSLYKESCHINSCLWLSNGSALVSSGSTEFFGTESQGFTLAAPLVTPRDGHTATLLADGNTVLIVGGTNHTVNRYRYPTTATATPLASAELFR